MQEYRFLVKTDMGRVSIWLGALDWRDVAAS